MAMQDSNLPGFRALLKTHDIICKSTLDPLEFSNKMLQEGLINDGVYSDVRAKPHRPEQIATLLNAIRSNGAMGAFETVLKCMRLDRSLTWLADRLNGEYT